MQKIVVASLLFVSALAMLNAADVGPIQSQRSFEAAIRNHSTAPSYVMITVVDDATGEARTACTTANFLLGAIHREHDLGYDGDSLAMAERLALENTAHVFHFSKRSALENIPIQYSQQDIETVREKLAGLSAEQLRDGFSSYGYLHAIYRSKPHKQHVAYRDATACVLIERGLSPGMGDIGDALWIAP
jgi:hypothetical protein